MTHNPPQYVPERPPRPPLASRPLIYPEQSERLEALFKVLANSTRLRLLHALVLTPDLSVSELAAAIDMKVTAVSNQLQKLVDRGILAARRNGNSIHYRIVDACVIRLLDNGWCLAEEAALRDPNACNAA